MLMFEKNTEPGRNAEALPFASRHPAAPGRTVVCMGGAAPRTPPRRRNHAERGNAKQSCPSGKSCNPVENADQDRLVAEQGNPKPILFPAG